MSRVLGIKCNYSQLLVQGSGGRSIHKTEAIIMIVCGEVWSGDQSNENGTQTRTAESEMCT
jgi:hypothetical protein